MDKDFLDKTAKPVNLVVKQCVCNKQDDRKYVLWKKKLNGEFRQLKLTSKKLGDNLFATVLPIIKRHANWGSNCIYTLHIVGEEQEDLCSRTYFVQYFHSSIFITLSTFDSQHPPCAHCAAIVIECIFFHLLLKRFKTTSRRCSAPRRPAIKTKCTSYFYICSPK